MPSNRKINSKVKSWAGWLGNMRSLNVILAKKKWFSLWGPVMIANSICRAIANVSFADNPVSGALMMLGFAIADSQVAVAALLAGILAMITLKFLSVSDEQILSGVPYLNSILVGTVVAAVFPPVLEVHFGGMLWGLLVITLALSCYISQGLATLMQPCGLPALSLPFNFAGTMLFFCLRLSIKGMHLEVANELTSNDLNKNNSSEIMWDQVFKGSILASAQVYGVGNLICSILTWIGLIFCSPILGLFSYLGSLIGCLIGVAINAPATTLYGGLWGYNSLLAAGGMVYFLVPTPKVLLSSLVGASLAAAIQACLTPIFFPTSLPALTYPFVAATLLMLSVAKSESQPFPFVKNLSTPEIHLYEYYYSTQNKHENEEHEVNSEAESNI